MVPRIFGVLLAAALLTGCVGTSSGTARIEGTFRAPSGGNTLTLDDGHWLLESGIRTKGGSYTLDADAVAFFITESNHPAYLQGGATSTQRPIPGRSSTASFGSARSVIPVIGR